MADGSGGGGGDWGNGGLRHAILRGHIVVPVRDWMEWALWSATNDRHVGHTRLGACCVSTVFLGLDHGFGGEPMWFETCIFRRKNQSRIVERYTTWDEAEAGHASNVRIERASFNAFVAAADCPGFPDWITLPGLVPVTVIAYDDGHAVLEDGQVIPVASVYRSRRRVPLRAATYRRRFGVQHANA